MSSHVGEWEPVNTLLTAVIVAVFVVFALIERASRRLITFELRDGRVVSARGRAPPGLVGEVEDLAMRDRVQGRFVVLVNGDGVGVRADTSIAPSTTERLRNVVGRFPLAAWRNAPRIR